MNWFKHYVNASDDIRVFRLKDEMGYTGLGIYWTIMEMMARGGGCYVRVGLTALKNRRTPKERIDRVLDGFGLFHTDADGRVTIVPPAADERPTSGITLPKARQINTSESADNKGDNSFFLAPAHVNKKREEKKREEENPSNSPVEVAQSATSDELRATSDEMVQEESNRTQTNTDDTDKHGFIGKENNPCDSVQSVSSVCQSLSTERIIHELRTNRAWQEAVCMTSGYGALLMRHFDHAIDLFLQHVRAGADEVELTYRRRAMNYFRNFTRLSHPAGRKLKEELEKRTMSDKLQATSYECHPDGKLVARSSSLVADSPFEDPPGPHGERSYHGGRPLPPDAPPRPSPHAEWDEAEEKWLIMN